VGAQQKRRRLSRSAEFDRVYRHGRSASSRHLVLYAFPRSDERGTGSDQTMTSKIEDPRLGVSVGRRVGGAVVRNRVKRLLREAFWSLDDRLPDAYDYVIVARSDAKALDESEGLAGIERDLSELIGRLGLSGEGDGEGGEQGA
jgi:ribonuclease P protein component